MKKVKKVWGKEEWWVNNDLYCFKKLYLKKGYQCSCHQHLVKDETFIIEKGLVKMEVRDETITMKPGDKVRIKPNNYHRFTGLKKSVIIEVSTKHMDEDSYRVIESGKVKNV